MPAAFCGFYTDDRQRDFDGYQLASYGINSGGPSTVVKNVLVLYMSRSTSAQDGADFSKAGRAHVKH